MANAGFNYTLFLDQRCNSYCIFCGHRLIDAATRSARTKAGLNVIQGEVAFGQSYPRFHQRYDLEAAVADLKDARSRGVTQVSIQGGEPTLWPALPALLRRVQELNFSLVGMVSNGRRLADAAFCKELLDAGLRHLSLSFLGATPATHDALSLVPGSFEEAIAGLRNLELLGAKREHGLVLNVNFIVSKNSAPELPLAVKFFHELGVDAIQAHLVQFGGLASDPAVIERVAFDVPGELQPLGEALRLARELGISLHLQDLPPCLHPELTSDALRGIATSMSKRPHAFGGPAQSFKRTRHSARETPAACEGCWFEDDCPRLALEYLPNGGHAAFQPVNDESFPRRIERQLGDGAAPTLRGELERLADLLGVVALLVQLLGPLTSLQRTLKQIHAAIYGLMKAAARNSSYSDVYLAFRLLLGISSPREVAETQVRSALRARAEAPQADYEYTLSFGSTRIALSAAHLEDNELVAKGRFNAHVASSGPALLRALQDEFLCAPLRHAERLRVQDGSVEVWEHDRWTVAWVLKSKSELRLGH